MVTMKIKPVGFSGDNVLKWQASVVFDESGQQRAVSGDPMPTEENAVESLENEIKKWSERLKKAKLEIKNWHAKKSKDSIKE